VRNECSEDCNTANYQALPLMFNYLRCFVMIDGLLYDEDVIRIGGLDEQSVLFLLVAFIKHL
jgi:hypothetical protein